MPPQLGCAVQGLCELSGNQAGPLVRQLSPVSSLAVCSPQGHAGPPGPIGPPGPKGEKVSWQCSHPVCHKREPALLCCCSISYSLSTKAQPQEACTAQSHRPQGQWSYPAAETQAVFLKEARAIAISSRNSTRIAVSQSSCTSSPPMLR